MPCCKDSSNNDSSCACSRSQAPSDAGTSSTVVAPAVPLPRRQKPLSNSENGSEPPLWAITSTASSTVSAPLPAKCDRHTEDRDGVCCKDLKGDDERTLIDPDVVRDIVIGLSDGLTVPFALTAGLSSIGDSKIVVIGGLAELIAGAISMGVGGFLASQSERDHFRYLRTQTRERVKRSCDGEMEREVHAVLGPLGVEEKISRDVADCLRKVEQDVVCGPHGSLVREQQHPKQGSWWSSLGRKRDYSPLTNGHANGDTEETAGGLRWSDDVGLTAFLLKFGEGLEEVPTKRLYISAFTIGMGYFLGGLIPLIPYFFVTPAQTALIYSCVITGVILLIFGGVKTHVTGATGGFGGYVWGAVSMLAVGGGAAAAAYGIVRALEA
ncbi:hypothetical protein FRC03_002174 [Tulasnella sp. 419]|nr:hypothetical protein FRC02_001242 [Tulasnella sp. 418]KAG8944108.1 hypothetical protein FRC03_002174 [Tulasnella sp. 419]